MHSEFEIQGPMGKGLCLSQASRGVHIAISAGTGILAFVDLVARIHLQNIKALPHDFEMLHPEFKLVLCCSFADRQSACCLDFCEKVAAHCIEHGFKNFELVTRLSKISKKRWDQEWLGELLEMPSVNDITSRSVQQVWVCATPTMNAQFDKWLHEKKMGFAIDIL